jgi:hypothetical protein
MEMFVGVRPCTTIFKHFYSLVGTGKKRGEIGAYYFQLRHGMTGSYIAAFSSSKWEDWREGWVIAAVEPHDRLELPTEGLQSDRSTWKARPTIPAELDPVLYRIKKLARSGLTSMMVLGDFLKRRIAPLQQRSRMAYVYTGLNKRESVLVREKVPGCTHTSLCCFPFRLTQPIQHQSGRRVLRSGGPNHSKSLCPSCVHLSIDRALLSLIQTHP